MPKKEIPTSILQFIARASIQRAHELSDQDKADLYSALAELVMTGPEAQQALKTAFAIREAAAAQLEFRMTFLNR